MIILPAAATIAGLPRAAVFGIAGAVVATGIAVMRSAPRQKVDRIFCYDDGLAQVMEQDLDSHTMAARLPAAAADCQRGAPVVFGALSVSREGLAWDAGRAPAMARSAPGWCSGAAA